MSRAIVLGGGGVTGIAWEAGVLTGLAEAGTDLCADVVIGTSAGAFVGAALAGGHLAQLFDAQRHPSDTEPSVRLPRMVFAGWVWAYVIGRRDPERIAVRLGAQARRRRPLADPATRRRTVQSRLYGSDWPPALKVTALDARTGALRVLTAADGATLVDGVSASSAVPGISPPVDIDGRPWIDGGMVCSANARVAQGCAEILVIAPLPRGPGGLPSVQDDIAALSSGAVVRLIVPDGPSAQAIGSNIYDPARRTAAAAAGRVQGATAGRDVPAA